MLLPPVVLSPSKYDRDLTLISNPQQHTFPPVPVGLVPVTFLTKGILTYSEPPTRGYLLVSADVIARTMEHDLHLNLPEKMSRAGKIGFIGGIMERKMKVLFLSTGNSTRSQMAQGFLSALAADRLLALSAGVKPGILDPLAAEVMNEVGIDILGQESIDVAQALKIHFGYVVTLYDAAKERSPIFPFTFNLLPWSILDPMTVTGSPAQRKDAFRSVRDEIHLHVQGFLAETAEKEQPQRFLVNAA